MVYKENFIAVVKVDGKILRERKREQDGEPCVVLPFGCEYTLLMKNQATQDCVARITIDGQDVLDGNEIIIRANKSVELEGFMSDDHVSHCFKFIQKTDRIVEHRGDRIDDGIIRIEYQFAKKEPEVTNHHHYHHHHGPCPVCGYYTCRCFHPRGVWCASDNSGSVLRSATYSATASCGESMQLSMNAGTAKCAHNITGQSVNIQNDEGITVKGSDSDQKFKSAHIGTLESYTHFITIRLTGGETNTDVKTPVYVKTKIECETCGKKNKSSNRFCSNCGTSLM